MIARLFAFLLLCWLLGFAWFALLLPRPAPVKESADAVVVLTGGPGRIERGLEVLSARKVDRMLISGVDPEVKPAELAEIYGQHDQFACCIDLGFRSVDTRSNALETARWVARHRVKSLRLVTSDWHIRRARLELDIAMGDRTVEGSAKSSKVRVIEDAVPTAPSLRILFLEYNKYWLRLFAALIGI